MSHHLNNDAVASAAAVFAALGDPTRLALVERLSDGRAHSIVQLTSGIGLTRQGVTKHLSALEAAGIVASKRTGRETHFSIERQTLENSAAYLARVSRQWDETLGRLESLLAKTETPPKT
ncbi:MULTISPECIES: helix-turn-helix transcriptional regulator [unclassified Xanthobacter]|uniref:ArsR/SmtB family transcription factor n=1 Tax=unclassified Xanthobacter TaxID=2623496 RepID=UPI001F46ECD2|nr:MULTISPECIES: metalloregulator ArsR/SmtB family transcription factor [unclassified Xanthobacter]